MKFQLKRFAGLLCPLVLLLFLPISVFAAAPSITAQPQSTNVLAGANATFKVTASGSATLRYNWSFNGVNLVNSTHIGGATNATLTVSNLVAGDAGNYRVVITNTQGSVTSSIAALTVWLPPAITASPTNSSVVQSNNATFTVTVTGTSPLNYRWQRGGTNLLEGGRINGQGKVTINVIGALTNDAGSYRVIVTNLYGSATSAVATLTVLVPAKIITQPLSQTVLAGTQAVFSVTADGTAPLNYRWLLNGTSLTNNAHVGGATNATLTVSNLVAGDAGNYSVTVTNNYGSAISSNAALTVVFPPAISTQPAGLAVDVGTPFAFAVSATGTATLNYQWLFNGSPLSGQTNPTLSYATAAMNQSGNYSIVVTNLYGSVTSSNTALQVTNSPPTITALAGQRTFPTLATKPMTFTVGDLETSSASLIVTGVAGDTNLVPTTNIVFNGSGANRTVVVTPAAGLSGSTVITLTVMDAQGATASANFLLTVTGFTDIGAGMTGVWGGNASWGDYDNDGKLDVLVNGKDGSGNGITKIYHNAGGGVFTDIGAGVQGLYAGAAVWGDYNNDGKLDLMLSGTTTNSVIEWLIYRNVGGSNFVQTANPNNIGFGGSVVKFVSLGWGDYDNDGRLDALFYGWPYCNLLHNAGGDTFTDSGVSMGGGSYSSVTWGDFNNDGRRDFVVTQGSPPTTLLYRNDGGGNFTVLTTNLPGYDMANMAAGDFNNDGRLDLVVTGWNTNNVDTAQLLRNDGNGVFTDAGVSLPGQNGGAMAWGDFDNDGYLDLAVATYWWTRIYHNNGDGTFTDTGLLLPGVYEGSLAWGDFDNDGHLDLLLCGWGFYSGDYITRIYRNNGGAISDTPPTPPGNLSATVNGTGVGLSWSAATDTNQSGGFSYNVRVGTTSGGVDVVSPMADAATGFRRVPALGNADENLSWPLTNLAAGTYYWSVQAVDHAWAGSAFAAEKTFTLAAPGITVQPASQIIFFGNTLNLSVTASGSNLNYQWQFNGTNLPGATGTTLAVTNMNAALAGNYQVVINNVFGTLVSSNAVVSVPEVVSWGYAGATNVSSPLTNVQLIAAGNYGSWALKGDATSAAWGAGAFNPPGTGSGNLVAASMSMSGDFSLGLQADGKVLFWGYNIFGEGNVPADLTNCISVAAGEFHALAVKADGTVKAWGWNDSGQCNVPAGLNNVVAVAAGESHSLALKADGTVVGWGADTYGEIAQMTNLVNVTAIAAGHQSSVALLADGTVASYGFYWSQPALTNIVAIAGGDYHALALKAEGTVTAWGGYNSYGEENIPTGLTNVLQIAAGTAHSTALIGAPAPRFLRQPQNASLLAGGRTYFFAPASGRSPLNYQWYFNGTNISGAHRSNLILDNASAANAGNYFVVVSNSFGSVTSAVVTLAVNYPPAIISQPTNQTVVAGGQATFAILTTGDTPLWYQLLLNGVAVPGMAGFAGTNYSFVLGNVQTNQQGIYSILVTNNSGAVVSSNVALTVLVPVTFTTQPVGKNLYVGSSTTLTAAATGTLPISLQWLYNGVIIPNATNATLLLTNLQIGQSGNYSLSASNLLGAVLSSNAVLVVSPLPPCTPVASGLVSWWPAEGDASDITATNNGLLLAGLGFAPGENGLAFNFTSSNQTVRIPASAGVDVGAGAGFTVEAWINPTDVTQAHPLFEWNDGTYWGVHFHIAPGQPFNVNPGPGELYANITDSGGFWHQMSSPGGVVVANVFQHVALTYDKASGVATIYCNGQVVAQSTLGSFTPKTALDLYLGQRPAPAGEFTGYSGLMDEASIYNRALSSNEIAAIYAAAVTGKCVPVYPPSLALQPASRAVPTNAAVAFSVTATGTKPLNYQWYFNNSPLANDGHYFGVTSASLTVSNAQVADAGNYFVVITNIAGAVTSSVAVLQVVSVPPAIVLQPQGQYANVGTNVLLTSAVTGDALLNFQWYFNGILLTNSAHILGSTSSNLTMVNVQTSDTGNYFMVVTNLAGMATSSVVAVTILSPPVVAAQPTGRSVPPGWPTTFSASFTGGTPLTYQWQLNGTNIPGATNTTYAIAAVGTNDLGLYHLVASNLFNVTASADAKLTFGNVAVWGRNLSGESQTPPDLTNAIAVAGSFGASFAARTDGSLVSWGAGIATNIPTGATNVVGLSSSAGTVVLRSDGTIAGWNFGAVANYPVPTASNIVAVAAGYNFGFALRAEGTLVAWGGSPYTNYPAGLNHVTAVACGIGHSLALKNDGTVVAWGDGVKVGATNVPFNLTNVVGIAAGYAHSLALKGDGTVTAWGSGTGTNLPASLTNIAAIFAGNYSGGQSVSLAIRSNGTVVVWGDNSFGETNPPAALANLNSVTGAGAANHALTVLNSGSPLIIRPPVGLTTFVGRDVTLRGAAVGAATLSYQWLSNGTNVPGATNTSLIFSNIQTASTGSYQLVVSNAVGVAVSLPAALTVISNNTLTLLSSPAAVTNAYQGGRVVLGATVLGNGPLQYQWFFSTTNTGYVPVTGATNDLLVLEPALASQSGNYYLAVSNQFGGITSLGSPAGPQTPAVVKILFARAWGYLPVSSPPVNVTNAIAIAVGSFSSGHYFALGADGKLKSWAGYSPIYYNETNVAALSSSSVTAIAAGYMDSLALKSDGTVYAWGYNQYGETNSPAGLANVTAIACGDYHDLALKADGTVVGWGQNTYGQATNTASATNIVAIAAGSQHSLALRADGTVAAWGYNGFGQTVVPAGATNVIAIAAGYYHSLALRANGTVIGWGYNNAGQLTIPASATNIVAIAAGVNHSTLLRPDGTVIMVGIVSQTLASNTVPADLANVVALVGGGDHDFGLLGNRAPAFTVQPWNRNIYRGTASVMLAGKVSGVQPVSYQWRFNGANISAATNDVLTLTNLQIGQSGSYQLIASNAYGVTASKAAKITVTVPLGEAMDVTNLTWISSGSSLWFGETNVTHDGVDAAQSGSIGSSQETILQTTVATNWSGRYTFWWKVSSEAYFDTLEFRINGVSQTNISGEVDWQPVSLAVPAGTNILQWRYSKDTSNSGGQDTAWVDQFVYVPDPPVITLQPTPTNQTVNLGANVNYFIRANGGTLNYQWLQNGSNVVGGNSSSLNLNGVSRAQNGNYFVVVTNSGGGVTSSVVNLKVLVPQLLGAPVMQPGGAFQLSSTDANGGLLTPADLANLQAQVSTNLRDWTTLANALTLTNGVLMLQDPAATNAANRFYRILEN